MLSLVSVVFFTLKKYIAVSYYLPEGMEDTREIWIFVSFHMITSDIYLLYRKKCEKTDKSFSYKTQSQVLKEIHAGQMKSERYYLSVTPACNNQLFTRGHAVILAGAQYGHSDFLSRGITFI